MEREEEAKSNTEKKMLATFAGNKHTLMCIMSEALVCDAVQGSKLYLHLWEQFTGNSTSLIPFSVKRLYLTSTLIRYAIDLFVSKRQQKQTK